MPEPWRVLVLGTTTLGVPVPVVESLWRRVRALEGRPVEGSGLPGPRVAEQARP
jgi:hypothetical protein